MKQFWATSAKGSIGRIDIYDYIDFYGVNASSFSRDFAALEEKSASIEVHINSPGGDLFDGITIYNRIQYSKVPVDVYVDGLAASSASVVAMAGRKSYMAANAMLMMHNASTLTYGNEQDHEATIVMLKAAKKALMAAYMQKSGKPEDEIAALLDANGGSGTWMTADEAKAAGLVDEVVGEIKIAAKFDLNEYGYDAPAPLLALFDRKAAPNAPAAKKGATKMADKETPDAMQPATLEELKAACDGASPEFLLRQLEAKATQAQAMKAWMVELKAQAEKAKSDAEAATKAKIEAEEQAKVSKPGVQPLNADAGKTTDEDPIAAWNALVAEKAKTSRSKPDAVIAAAKENPELRAAYVEAFNARNKK